MVSDSNLMDYIPYEEDSFYVFDKAYVSTPRLYKIHKKEAFFVVRKKNNMRYEVIEDRNYNNPQTGVMADQIIRFTSRTAKKGYPETLRYVVYYSRELESTLAFFNK